MTDFHTYCNPAAPGLSVVVDVFDRDDLFRPLVNERVLQLSKLGGATGFADNRSIHKSTGIASRRILCDGVLPIDVALAIVEKLEAASGCGLGEFRQVILCHSHVEPEACKLLAQELAERLGLSPEKISGVNYGCAGFLKLVSDGANILESLEAGQRVALVSVETPEFWHDASDRLFCGIVSAGATAAVLEVEAGLTLSVCKSDDLEIPASRRPNPEPLFTRETEDVFDFDGNRCLRTVMRMNPEPVFINGIELMLDHLRSALLSIDRSDGDRVIVAPHQPSGKLLKALVAAAKNEFPDIEFLNNLEFYGNTISSSVPTLVSRLDEVLERNDLAPPKDGDHVILLAAGICMSRMDDHMSAGHACFRWRSGVLNKGLRGPGVPMTAAK